MEELKKHLKNPWISLKTNLNYDKSIDNFNSVTDVLNQNECKFLTDDFLLLSSVTFFFLVSSEMSLNFDVNF